MSDDKDGSLEHLKDRLEYGYRKHIEIPTPQLHDEILLKQGELKGLKKAIDLVEARRNDHELPLSWADA